MAKFYIESGNFRTILQEKHFIDAAVGAMFRIQRSIRKEDIRLGPTLSVNEVGFILDFLDEDKCRYLSKEYIYQRKQNYAVVKNIAEQVDYRPGMTIFLPTSQIVKLARII